VVLMGAAAALTFVAVTDGGPRPACAAGDRARVRNGQQATTALDPRAVREATIRLRADEVRLRDLGCR